MNAKSVEPSNKNVEPSRINRDYKVDCVNRIFKVCIVLQR